MNIHKVVSTKNNFYLIDGFSNEIYQLDSQKDLSKITKNDLLDYKKIENLIPHNYKNKIISQAKTLVLEITEQCNLRCTYCVFDDKFKNERTHSKKYMNLKTAYNAINNFQERISNEAYIVFYGGEPLLQFDIIQKLVKYAKKKLKNVKFSFTTNAIYLTKEKIDFFQKNKFLITVSLDGSKKIHDKYRIDKNYNATFDIIMNNLNYIYDNFSTYYKEFIQINCVVNNINDFKEINTFFSSNKLVNDISIRFSNQIQKSYELSEHIDKTFTKEYILELIKTNNFKNHPLEYNYYGTLLKKIKFRPLGEDAKINKVKCIPFSNRTYIRTNGNVQFCERIENMGITNLDTDNMLQTASYYLKEYQNFIEEKCNNCFAYNYCDMCYASFINDSKLDKNKADIKCLSFNNDLKIAFEIYIELTEENENLLENF